MTDAQTPEQPDSRTSGKSTGQVGYRNPPVEHQFKPGNEGRKRGSRNKLGDEFLKALHDDFVEHGPTAIQACRQEKPDAYLRVIAGLLPKDVNLNVNRYDEATDDELIARLRQLDADLRPFLDAQGADRDSGGTEAEVRH